MKSAIWWVRRDLRLSDNQALAAAADQAEIVVPVFILDPKLLSSSNTGQNRLGFLEQGLCALDEDLQKRGSRLIFRMGEPVAELRTLLAETGATNIYAEADVSPYARRRDENVSHQLPLTLTPGVTAHSPQELYKPDGNPYTIYTPFSRKWHSLPFPGKPLQPPSWLPAVPALRSHGITNLSQGQSRSSFIAGEAAAQRRLEKFSASAIDRYAEGRDRLDQEGTSSLSPYLRFGMLSARQVVWSAREAAALRESSIARHGAETWLNELIWRDFYASILYYFPFVLRTAFRPELRQINWRDDKEGFNAWAEGRTGYPVVDAAMRQLNRTGWMHNRARMIVASFLTKDLLIDWRRGERYFMQHLVDGDPAANNGGWQWTAGTGTDAAPYFRVFNPVLQGRKYDPQGTFVRRWLPELEAVPNAFIHAPWEMSSEMQIRTGCRIGKNYPAPIVDHALARQRVLAAYHR